MSFAWVLYKFQKRKPLLEVSRTQLGAIDIKSLMFMPPRAFLSPTKQSLPPPLSA